MRNIILPLLITSLLVIPSAYGANPTIIPDPGERFLQQQQQRKNQELLERTQPPTKVKQLRSPEIKKKEKCLPIDHITLKDAVHLSSKERHRILAPYEGSCMGGTNINKLIVDITNYYISKGYVTTRTYIPKQNLSSKGLILNVIPGKVESISLNKNKTWKDRMQARMAFPHLKGKLLNLRDSEQGIDQINRLPSSSASLQLWPGQEVGGTEILVTNQRKDTLRGTIAYDNGGQSATGRDRMTLGIEEDHLLGLSETLGLYYIGSNDTNALAFNGSIPYGYWTLSGTSSYSDYLSLLEGSAELFGTTWNNSIKLDRVVYRDTIIKASVYGALNVKESSRLINEVILSPQPLTVLRTGITGLWHMKKGVLNFDAAYSQGVTMFGAIEDPDQLADDVPRAQFHKLDGILSYYRPLAYGALRSSINAQYSFDPLYSSEQLNMGDNSTVRGFTGSQVSGDSGIYNRNEWSVPIPTMLAKHTGKLSEHFMPYSFVDVGYAQLKASNDPGYMAGLGVGARFSYGRFSGDIAAAIPVLSSGNVEDNGFELYLNLVGKAF